MAGRMTTSDTVADERIDLATSDTDEAWLARTRVFRWVVSTPALASGSSPSP